jgi:hypothetical protein
MKNAIIVVLVLTLLGTSICWFQMTKSVNENANVTVAEMKKEAKRMVRMAFASGVSSGVFCERDGRLRGKTPEQMLKIATAWNLEIGVSPTLWSLQPLEDEK